MIRCRQMAVLTLLLVLLTGCWDYRELDQLALVMAVGIDKAQTPGRLLVTVQIARPSGEQKGKSGGASDGLGSVYTASSEGDTIFAAVRNLAQFTSRRIMWAHNNVVVIGEELAREDITPVIDFFTRNQELRMRSWVVVARGEEARALVTAKTGMEEVPANSISALFRYAQLPGEAVSTDMNMVAAAFFGPDTEPVISAMGIRKGASPVRTEAEKGSDPQVELRGSAVFHGKRLVGYLDSDAGRGMLWLRGEMRNAVLTIPCPGDGERNMAVEVRSPDTEVTSTMRGGKPEFHVSVDAQGSLLEQDCATPKMSAQELKTYAEAAYAKKIEASIRLALEALQQEFRTDAVMFGRRVHSDQPQWWRANRHRWGEIFPEIRTYVSVRVDIPKMGLYVRPMRPNLEIDEGGAR